jgi:hypothetical protein
MRQFECHKVVKAEKIDTVIRRGDGTGGTLVLVTGQSIEVDRPYLAKHLPLAGGYFVEYEGGYRSWSPAEAFESGYTEQAAAPAEPTVYPVPPDELARLEEAFTYHAPKGDQVIRYAALRGEAKVLAKLFLQLCPPGRERALARTHLEEAVMWANAAIARGE